MSKRSNTNNRANQRNDNNPAYWKSRGYDGVPAAGQTADRPRQAQPAAGAPEVHRPVGDRTAAPVTKSDA